VYQDVFFHKSNSFWQYHYFYCPDFRRTFNEQTIRGRVSDGGGDGDCSILADDVFTGLNSFTQDLGTTGISNTGNLVMDTEASEIRWNSKQVYDSRLLYANNRFGFVIRNGQVRMFMSNSHTKTFYLVRL
jgi:hypothetical protein